MLFVSTLINLCAIKFSGRVERPKNKSISLSFLFSSPQIILLAALSRLVVTSFRGTSAK